jgi:CRP-like cAMP-binding protein
LITQTSNHLLSSLSSADFGLVEPHLEAVTLEPRRTLEDINKPITHAYFPSSGLASVVAKAPRGREIEAGIIGREGMTGINVVMGNDRSANHTYMQVAGHGQRLQVEHLRNAMEESLSLRNCFLHFAQAFMLQIVHTAMANGQAKIEERLARWLLMAHDRLDGNELPLTHEFLALMLSVRRPGVTTALQQLEFKALITLGRATIIVEDREGLKETANGIYGIPEAEYARLTGWHAKA